MPLNVVMWSLRFCLKLLAKNKQIRHPENISVID